MGLLDKLFGKKEKSAEKEKERNSQPILRDTQEFRTIMTSQLVAFWIDTNNENYKKEYLRRMKICQVSDEIAEKTFDFENSILKRIPRPEMLNPNFIAMGLFSLTSLALPEKVTYYETHFDYPFSYVVKLSDEAEWHFWNSHERTMPDEVWEEIYMLADKNRKLFIPYAMNMVENLGWSIKQVNNFSYHEQGMLDYYRWGRNITSAAKEPWGIIKPDHFHN